MKTVPVLGTLVLIGAIIQVGLGLQISWASMDSLIPVHMVIGIVGLLLVLALTAIAVKAKAATSVKAAMVVLLILVFVQVGSGMQLLGGADQLTVMHEANGILIVLLSLVAGGLTMMNARRQKTA